jgi:FSR family fosmidomycin resistance protein-like MFS transporter
MNTARLDVGIATAPAAGRKRVLGATCGAHVLHDGYSDLIYVLLPVWQAAFGLSYGQVGFLKTAYSGTMAALQVPSGLAAERVGERAMLVAGTVVAAAALIFAGFTTGFLALALCLVLGGLGASVQHPLGSSLTSRAFDGSGLRAALSTYNFSGDIGKVLLPAATAGLIAVADWNTATIILGVAGLFVAAAVYAAIPAGLGGPYASKSTAEPAEGGAVTGPTAADTSGFAALSAIGIVDSATRTGLLTLLPFLLTARGAGVAEIGLALSLVFAGGAAGKFVCGVIAVRVGILRSVIVTECATTALILALLLPMPKALWFVLLPLLGVALNGTSSVLYGTVAELVTPERRARAFSLFYTYTIGAGALAPMAYGFLGDAIGLHRAIATVACMVLLVLPLTLWLRPAIRRIERERPGPA